MNTMSDDRLIRLENLRTFGLGPTELKKKFGRSVSYWSDMLRGQKSFGEDLARAIEESAGLPRYWMDEPHDAESQHAEASNPHGEIGVKKSRNLIDLKNNLSFTLLPVVQFQGLDMSQKNDALIDGQEWISTPGQFSERAKITKMPDNSMFPEIYPGEYIAFDPGIPADAGDTVLIKDEHGGFWIRKYRPLPGGKFDAVAANDDHAPLRSSDGGLQVLAVLVGHWRGRRARSH